MNTIPISDTTNQNLAILANARAVVDRTAERLRAEIIEEERAAEAAIRRATMRRGRLIFWGAIALVGIAAVAWGWLA